MDRLLIGIVVIGAALFLDSFHWQRVVAYLAGAAGLFAVHERLRRDFSPSVSALTVVLIFAATSLFWSMTQSQSSLDAVSFAVVAVLWCAMPAFNTRALQLAMWVVLAAIPVVIRFAFFATPSPGDSAESRSVADALFSSPRGFFSLTPIVYVATIGLGLYVYRKTAEATPVLAVFCLWLLVAATMPRSVDAQPFGHGLTAALVLVAPGLASIIDYARAKPLVAVTPLVVGAAVWNYWLMVQYTAGSLPKDEPVSFATMVRQQADVHTRSPYIYPFALPANLLFAWREGLPADRYELLSRVPRSAEFELAMDRQADPFVLDGFGGLGPTPSGAVRWTAARRATIAFPLAPPTSNLAVEVWALARGEEPAVGVDVAIEINGHEIGQFVAMPTSDLAQTMTIPAASVGRVLRAGYNRLTIVNRGIHRLDPNDQRPLGPLAARSGAVPYPVAIQKVRIAPAS